MLFTLLKDHHKMACMAHQSTLSLYQKYAQTLVCRKRWKTLMWICCQLKGSQYAHKNHSDIVLMGIQLIKYCILNMKNPYLTIPHGKQILLQVSVIFKNICREISSHEIGGEVLSGLLCLKIYRSSLTTNGRA